MNEQVNIRFDSVVFRAIDQAIILLKARHKTHISVYGRDNDRRLTGRHETANVRFLYVEL